MHLGWISLEFRSYCILTLLIWLRCEHFVIIQDGRRNCCSLGVSDWLDLEVSYFHLSLKWKPQESLLLPRL